MRHTATASPTDTALWVLSWILLAVVVAFSAGPEARAVEEAGLSDKLLHFVGYAATAMSFLLAAVWRPGRGRGRYPGVAVAVVVALVLLGAGLEVVQAVRPDRTAEAADAVANGTGVVAAALVWRGVRAVSARSGVENRQEVGDDA